MTIIEKYRELAQKLKENFYNDVDDERLEVYDNIGDEAMTLLNEDFREQVRNLWEFDLTNSWSSKNNREKLKNVSKCEFVYENHYDENKNKFINEHWDEVDNIIKILQDYIKELEEKEETQDNE